MKLTIKTLSNNLTFKVDIEPDKTVKDLKETIEREQGKDFPYSSQKLIFGGKILTDESKLSEYGFDEKKFIVLMTTRPPPAPKPAPSAPSATPEQTSSSAKPTNETKATTASVTQAKSTSATDPTSSTAAAATITTTTTASSTAASTTPAQTTATTNPPTTQQPPSFGSRDPTSVMPGFPSGLQMYDPQMAARVAAMMSQPQFRQMQDLIQQSPHLLSSTIESLAASDPEIYDFMSDNPDAFVNALNQPPFAGLRPQDISSMGGQQQQRQTARTGGGSGGMGTGGTGGGQQPGVEQLIGNVTDHDKEAIERLKELGFSELQAVQAYMACDKDEQLAANLLFQMD